MAVLDGDLGMVFRDVGAQSLNVVPGLADPRQDALDVRGGDGQVVVAGDVGDPDTSPPG